jgi:excisionase family DNA binding protein
MKTEDQVDVEPSPSGDRFAAGSNSGDQRPAVGEPDDEERDLPPFLTPQEVAERLRVSVWAVYDAVKDETLPAVRVGRAIRIPRHAVVVKTPVRRRHEA